MPHRQTGTPPPRVRYATRRQNAEAIHRWPERPALPPSRALAKYHVPKRVRLGLDRDKNAVGGEKLPQIRETVGVELQARTSVNRQDYVEASLIQRFVPSCGDHRRAGNPVDDSARNDSRALCSASPLVAT